MARRNTLICTVGTSLFEGNLSRLAATTPDLPDNWQAIKAAYDARDWRRLAAEFAGIDPTKRICGAEINTIEEAHRHGRLLLENLVFLVSDTPNGRNTGDFLKRYYRLRTDLDLRVVETAVIDQLQDERPKDFKVHGLRNLVRTAGEYIARFGGADCVAIDATGGYKAQIAIAVIVGQALNIPVFYKHERFSEIIDFPPLPVTFDYDILGRNADLLTDFERGRVFGSDEIDVVDDKLLVLLTAVDADDGTGRTLYELSPIGQIYLTGYRFRNPKPIRLIPAANKQPPSFRDDNFPTGFKEFVTRVCGEQAWVVTANSLSYAGQKSIKGIGFHVRDEGAERRLIGTYTDKDGFGARFWLHLTDESPAALVWAADVLNQRYRE